MRRVTYFPVLMCILRTIFTISSLLTEGRSTLEAITEAVVAVVSASSLTREGPSTGFAL